MNRSLTRNILRAARQTPDSEHPYTHLVEVELTFPREVFADEPAPWSPGPGFTQIMGGVWLRANCDGTQTGVVAGVGPKELPAADGGVWTDEEVWTVTSSDPGVFAWLDDKPHRVTWALGRPDVEVIREPYATHPQAAVDAYWEEFWERFGFTPELRPDGRRALALACAPNSSWPEGPWPLVDACGRIMAALGARARVRRMAKPGARSWEVPHSVSLMTALSHL